MKKEKTKKIILVILIIVGFIISFIGGLTFRSVNSIGVVKRFDSPNDKQYNNVTTTEVVYNGSVPVLYTAGFSGPDGVPYDASPNIQTADGGILRYQVNYSFVEGRGTNIILTYQYYYLASPYPFGYYTYDSANGSSYNVPNYSTTPLFTGEYTWYVDNSPMDTNYYNFYLDLELSYVESNYELIFFHITPKYYGRDMTGTRPPEESYYIFDTLRFHEFYLNTNDVVSRRGYGTITNSKFSILSGFTPTNLMMLPVYELQKQGYDFRGYVEGPDTELIYQQGYDEGFQDGLFQYERNNALGPVFKMFADASAVVFNILSIEVFSGITLGTIMLFPLIALLIGWILKLFFGG